MTVVKNSSIPRPPQIVDPARTYFHHRRADDIGVESGDVVERQLSTNVCPSRTTHPQRDGGSHTRSFRRLLTRLINNYAQSSGIMRKER
jgi:DNA gyrase subunit B